MGELMGDPIIKNMYAFLHRPPGYRLIDLIEHRCSEAWPMALCRGAHDPSSGILDTHTVITVIGARGVRPTVYYISGRTCGESDYVQGRWASDSPDEPDSAQCGCDFELQVRVMACVPVIPRQVSSEPDQKYRPHAEEQHARILRRGRPRSVLHAHGEIYAKGGFNLPLREGAEPITMLNPLRIISSNCSSPLSEPFLGSFSLILRLIGRPQQPAG